MKLLDLQNSDEKVIVDDDDYPLLSRYSWSVNQKQHVKASIYLAAKQQTILIHRLIMNPTGKQMVDHINGNRLDNRKDNLRVCYANENSWNRKRYDFPKTSKYKGVHFMKGRGKWVSYITCNGDRYHLGYFTNEDEAALAYNEKAKELQGEFAVLNKVGDYTEAISD